MGGGVEGNRGHLVVNLFFFEIQNFHFWKALIVESLMHILIGSCLRE